MAGRFGGIIYAVTFDGLAYAIDKISHSHPYLGGLLREQPELEDLPSAAGFLVDGAIVKQAWVMVDVVSANPRKRSLLPVATGRGAIK
jgi:hypothetical protein